MSAVDILRRERDMLDHRITEDRQILRTTENDVTMLRDRIDQNLGAIEDIDAALAKLDPDNYDVPRIDAALGKRARIE